MTVLNGWTLNEVGTALLLSLNLGLHAQVRIPQVTHLTHSLRFLFREGRVMPIVLRWKPGRKQKHGQWRLRPSENQSRKKEGKRKCKGRMGAFEVLTDNPTAYQ